MTDFLSEPDEKNLIIEYNHLNQFSRSHASLENAVRMLYIQYKQPEQNLQEKDRRDFPITVIPESCFHSARETTRIEFCKNIESLPNSIFAVLIGLKKIRIPGSFRSADTDFT
ncbi:hypothetical protein [Desulfonema magnum]|nr:hypothetical protein [Desulfonema magnum]